MGGKPKVGGIVLGFLLLGTSLGCGGKAAESPDGATHMQSLMEGDWFPAMPKDKLRPLLIAECALKAPPDEATLSQMLPTLQEHDTFAKIVKMRTDDFNSKEVEDLRKEIRTFEDSAIRVTPTRLYMKDESDGERKYFFYKVKWEDVNNITIFVRGDLMEWRFADHNHVTVVAGPEEMPLVRREGLLAEASK